MFFITRSLDDSLHGKMETKIVHVRWGGYREEGFNGSGLHSAETACFPGLTILLSANSGQMPSPETM